MHRGIGIIKQRATIAAATFGGLLYSSRKVQCECEVQSGFVCKTIIFIRHGQSEANAAFENAERHSEANARRLRDAVLSQKGREQAKAACAELARSRGQTDAMADDPWLLVSSPFRRAVQTALLVWPEAFSPDSDIRYEVAPEVREFMCGIDDIGSPRGSLQAEFPHLHSAFDRLPEIWWSMPAGIVRDGGLGDDVIQAFATNPTLFNFSDWGVWDGEPVVKHKDLNIVDYAGRKMLMGKLCPGARLHTPRIASAMAYLARQPEHYIVVVSHGAFISAFLNCLNKPPASDISNCQVVVASNVCLPVSPVTACS